MVRTRSSAKSLLEFLTEENPKLEGLARTSTQSRNEEWHTPRRVEKWKDFDFSVLKLIFEGKLWSECRKSQELYYPHDLLPEELDHKNEKTAERILGAWTVRVVNIALARVRESLNPVFWVAGSSRRYELAGNDPTDQDGSYQDPEEADLGQTCHRSPRQAGRHYHLRDKPRPSAKARLSGKKRSRSPSTSPDPTPKKKRYLNPDGGGVRKRESSVDRLPSDVKGKWESREVTKRNGRFLNRKGGWRDGMSIHDKARPLRQIYTYCVEANARYGFIITCEEVLLVRVSLLKEAERDDETTIPSEDLVQDRMIQNGRLEYKSIRWQEHREIQQKPEEFKKLTVNLSLWALFIMAGNSSHIGCSYKPLKEEKLARHDESSAEEDEESLSSLPQSDSTPKALVCHPTEPE